MKPNHKLSVVLFMVEVKVISEYQGHSNLGKEKARYCSCLTGLLL